MDSYWVSASRDPTTKLPFSNYFSFNGKVILAKFSFARIRTILGVWVCTVYFENKHLIN